MTLFEWRAMSERRDDTEDTRNGGSGRRRGGFGRRLRRVFLALVAAGAAVMLVGLVGFVVEIIGARHPERARGDGVVVLTGGRDRIDVALAILQSGAARRLLISGVNPATTADAIRRQTETPANLFACCVDLGRRAETTNGNAREAADWASEHQFASLVVVTSAYHIPRALTEMRAEFRRRGLNVTLQAIAVRKADLGATVLSFEPETVRVLAAEYLKYMLAHVRLIAEQAGLPPAAALPSPARQLASGHAPVSTASPVAR
jgi:uncharacterized SAM-binding protein YcdF (DUF218 family)